MATRKTASQPEGIVIDAETAKHICSLFNGVEMADKFFKSCQNTEFRQHVKGVYMARNVVEAFGKLKDSLNDYNKSEGVNSNGND